MTAINGAPSLHGLDGASLFQPDQAQPFIEWAFPVTQDLSKYQQRSLQWDLIIGVTAFAQLAGVSPMAGLQARLLPVVTAAVGPETEASE